MLDRDPAAEGRAALAILANLFPLMIAPGAITKDEVQKLVGGLALDRDAQAALQKVVARL